MSSGDFDELISSTTYKINNPNPNWKPLYEFEKPFGLLITYMLGSDLPKDTKDAFINKCMPLKEFRRYVREYFPKYENKIKLWETLHGITSKS